MPPTSSFGWRGEAPTPLFDDSGVISRSPEVGTRASSSPDDDPDDGAALSDRPRWSSTSEFLLAAVGSAVGLGNLLRFPYVTYAHGGAAFLIPYGLAVACLGVPVLWMELMLGQVLQRGVVDGLACLHARAWGVGVAATLAAFLLASYYSAIMSWVWVFLAASLADACPWADGAARGFFFDDALGRRDDADVASRGLGPARWWLVLGLTLNWLCCYACIFAGARSAGKAIWITMPLPYVLLFALAMKGASLPGSAEGVAFYFGRWEWSALGDGGAWVDAAAQIFFGLSVACGAMPAYASNCPRSERCERNAVVIAIANAATSVFAGFVVFAFLGHLARSERVPIADVAEGGWSLAFVAYPSAMALFEGPGAWQFFSVSFWLTLLCLGVDSAFALAEAVVCALCDRHERCRRNRSLTALGVCVACWIAGLPMTTAGGYQVVDVMDAYVSRYALVLAGLMECVFVGHGYGAERLRRESAALAGDDAEAAPSVFARTFAPMIRWVVPTALFALLCHNLYQESRGAYGGYPAWLCAAFGWVPCAVLPLACAAYGAARPMRDAGGRGGYRGERDEGGPGGVELGGMGERHAAEAGPGTGGT